MCPGFRGEDMKALCWGLSQTLLYVFLYLTGTDFYSL